MNYCQKREKERSSTHFCTLGNAGDQVNNEDMAYN